MDAFLYIKVWVCLALCGAPAAKFLHNGAQTQTNQQQTKATWQRLLAKVRYRLSVCTHYNLYYRGLGLT